MSEPKTHDYTRRGWGHDYGIDEVKRGGRQVKLYGWGTGIKKGDFLLLQSRDSSTRYRVKAIRYCTDPNDMWFATLDFAPRRADA